MGRGGGHPGRILCEKTHRGLERLGTTAPYYTADGPGRPRRAVGSPVACQFECKFSLHKQPADGQINNRKRDYFRFDVPDTATEIQTSVLPSLFSPSRSVCPSLVCERCFRAHYVFRNKSLRRRNMGIPRTGGYELLRQDRVPTVALRRAGGARVLKENIPCRPFRLTRPTPGGCSVSPPGRPKPAAGFFLVRSPSRRSPVPGRSRRSDGPGAR